MARYDALKGIPTSENIGWPDLAARLEHTGRGCFVSLATFRAICDRIETLEEVVRQNALTADDLPTAGWGAAAPDPVRAVSSDTPVLGEAVDYR